MLCNLWDNKLILTFDTGIFLHRRSRHYFTIHHPLRIFMCIIKKRWFVFIENIDVWRTRADLIWGAPNFYYLCKYMYVTFWKKKKSCIYSGQCICGTLASDDCFSCLNINEIWNSYWIDNYTKIIMKWKKKKLMWLFE